VGRKRNPYLGKAGHLVVMSEFLVRGWNVAIPEVDVGDDIYVVEDGKTTYRNVQVKTVTAKHHRTGDGYTGRFTIKADQLRLPQISLYYVFIVRVPGKTGKDNATWGEPVVISRNDLNDDLEAVGGIKPTAISVNVTLVHKSGLVKFRSEDWSSRIRDYSAFHEINH
jgi:hypothetical protein